jgi:hypothetical protein
MTTLKLFTVTNNEFELRDTLVHSYRTKDIHLINILQPIPAVEHIGFYLYNNTNESISVLPIFNVFPDESMPDVISTTTAIPAGKSQFINISPDYLIANFFSIEISASTAPTKGYVTGFAIVNYNYTIN